MRARRLGLAMAALVVPALLTLGPASPASAASWTWTWQSIVGSERYNLYLNDDFAGVSVQSVNDRKVTLSDAKADGFGQRTYWRADTSGAWKACVNEGGKGSSKSCTVPSGKWIQYQFCEKDGSVDVACAPLDSLKSAG